MLLLVVMAGRWLGAAVIFLCKLGLQVVQGIEELGVLLNQRQLLALQPADFEGLREGGLSREVRGEIRRAVILGIP